MQALAEHLIELADVQARTPVVIAQPGLRLRPPFYAALADALLRTAERDVSLEFVTAMDGWGSGVQRLALRRLINQVNSITPPAVQANLTAVISRPAGTQRPIVIGVACVELALPAWAESVKVCTRPTQATDFQLLIA